MIAVAVVSLAVCWRRGDPRRSKVIPTTDLVDVPLRRRLIGTYQDGLNPKHLAFYLDDFVFYFDRRGSACPGELFYHLLLQAVTGEPSPYKNLAGGV
jgi:hypothetical protein